MGNNRGGCASIRMTDAGHHSHRHQQRQALRHIDQTVHTQGSKLITSSFYPASFVLGVDHRFPPVVHVKVSQ